MSSPRGQPPAPPPRSAGTSPSRSCTASPLTRSAPSSPPPPPPRGTPAPSSLPASDPLRAASPPQIYDPPPSYAPPPSLPQQYACTITQQPTFMSSVPLQHIQPFGTTITAMGALGPVAYTMALPPPTPPAQTPMIQYVPTGLSTPTLGPSTPRPHRPHRSRGSHTPAPTPQPPAHLNHRQNQDVVVVHVPAEDKGPGLCCRCCGFCGGVCWRGAGSGARLCGTACTKCAGLCGRGCQRCGSMCGTGCWRGSGLLGRCVGWFCKGAWENRVACMRLTYRLACCCCVFWSALVLIAVLLGRW
jgi:hypothetical protein